MRVERLIYFLELYEYRNYTKVAQRNFISQTSLTQFVNSLEAEFGVKLFDRSTQPITPTPAGERFYREASILYRQYQYLKNAMEDTKLHPSASLRVKYTSPVDLQLFGPFLTEFQRTHPEILLQLSTSSFRLSAASLTAGESDVVIGANLPLEPSENVKIRVLYEGEFHAVVGHGHPLYDKEEITMDDMHRYPLIMLSKEIVGEAEFQTMIDRCAEDGFYPNIQKTADDLETILFYVSTENLMAFFPDAFLLGHYEAQLKKLPMKNNRHRYQIMIGYSIGNQAAMIFAQEITRYLERK